MYTCWMTEDDKMIVYSPALILLIEASLSGKTRMRLSTLAYGPAARSRLRNGLVDSSLAADSYFVADKYRAVDSHLVADSYRAADIHLLTGNCHAVDNFPVADGSSGVGVAVVGMSRDLAVDEARSGNLDYLDIVMVEEHGIHAGTVLVLHSPRLKVAFHCDSSVREARCNRLLHILHSKVACRCGSSAEEVQIVHLRHTLLRWMVDCRCHGFVGEALSMRHHRYRYSASVPLHSRPRCQCRLGQ